jgi:hypothetical protein
MGEHLPCYGASAGARTADTADGLGVRRAHSARLEASWEKASVGRCGLRAPHGLGQRWRREGARAQPSRAGRSTTGDARRAGARRRITLAPGLRQCC